MVAFHVSVSGSDTHPGTEEQPFKTIQRAASVARAGDLVTVHTGEYREWVRPMHGGSSEASRVVYQAAEGEQVVIKGSEIAVDWTHVEGEVYKTTLPDSMFGDFNPYREKFEGDWWIKRDWDLTLGEIWLNGQAMFAVDSLEQVKAPVKDERAQDSDRSLHVWMVEPGEEAVTLYANFQGVNPNEALVEVAARPACFYPDRTQVNYITVRGFEMCQAASPWAPPTAEQMAVIGPHWSKGWLIEWNHIHSGKCVGLSLGMDHSAGRNEWTHLGVKHGSQRQRESLFKALKNGWTRENVGSHIVRNNVIHDCEQAGIVGHMGCIFSEISGNHIYRIHAQSRFYGHEMAGIKLHAPIDVLIQGNRIHDAYMGVWLDWQAQGARVSGNLMYRNHVCDFYCEVSHGPYVVDNNILLSQVAIRDCAQGGAYAHNLVTGETHVSTVPNRFTPYHYPHSTDMLGLMSINGGDTRYYNNLFAPINQIPAKADDSLPDENKGKSPFAQLRYSDESYGISCYDGMPSIDEDWKPKGNVDQFAAAHYAMHTGGNVYYYGATPYRAEQVNVVNADFCGAVRLEESEDRVVLRLSYEADALMLETPVVNSALLGETIMAEAIFEDADGDILVIEEDYLGNPRGEKPMPGPFEKPLAGEQSFVVWERSM